MRTAAKRVVSVTVVSVTVVSVCRWTPSSHELPEQALERVVQRSNLAESHRQLAGDAADAGAAALAAFAGAVAYIAIFVAIGCVARRAAVWSLAFVFLVERLLGTALTGIAQWSPTWESRAAFIGLIDHPPTSIVRTGIPAGGGAILRLGVITLIALGIARWRLARMRLSGAAD